MIWTVFLPDYPQSLEMLFLFGVSASLLTNTRSRNAHRRDGRLVAAVDLALISAVALLFMLMSLSTGGALSLYPTWFLGPIILCFLLAALANWMLDKR